MSKNLEIKQEEIGKRQEVVVHDLGRAEPALREAQESVNSIQRSHLDELKQMLNPPNMVKYAIEAVIALITGTTKKYDWNECRQHLRKDGFI